MEKYIPFGSVDGDRKVRSGDIAGLFSTFFRNGLASNIADCLMVQAAEGMQVAIQPGRCCINGRVGLNDSAVRLQLADPNGILPRIDRIVLRLNLAERLIEEAVLTGEPNATPTPIELTRNEEIYELCLAEISVGADSYNVTEDMIFDTRYDSERCGFMGLNTLPVDMPGVHARYAKAMQEFVKGLQDALSGDVEAYLTARVAELGQALEHVKVKAGPQNLLIDPTFSCHTMHGSSLEDWNANSNDDSGVMKYAGAGVAWMTQNNYRGNTSVGEYPITMIVKHSYFPGNVGVTRDERCEQVGEGLLIFRVGANNTYKQVLAQKWKIIERLRGFVAYDYTLYTASCDVLFVKSKEDDELTLSLNGKTHVITEANQWTRISAPCMERAGGSNPSYAFYLESEKKGQPVFYVRRAQVQLGEETEFIPPVWAQEKALCDQLYEYIRGPYYFPCVMITTTQARIAIHYSKKLATPKIRVGGVLDRIQTTSALTPSGSPTLSGTAGLSSSMLACTTSTGVAGHGGIAYYTDTFGIEIDCRDEL